MIALGCLSVVLGIVGIFLPLLPTTPFLLLSAYCFSKSSPKLHNWLIQNKVLGPIVLDWEKHGVIRRKVKWTATISMLAMVSYPLVYMIDLNWVRAIVILIMVSVLMFIWSRPDNGAPQSEPE